MHSAAGSISSRFKRWNDPNAPKSSSRASQAAPPLNPTTSYSSSLAGVPYSGGSIASSAASPSSSSQRTTATAAPQPAPAAAAASSSSPPHPQLRWTEKGLPVGAAARASPPLAVSSAQRERDELERVRLLSAQEAEVRLVVARPWVLLLIRLALPAPSRPRAVKIRRRRSRDPAGPGGAHRCRRPAGESR